MRLAGDRLSTAAVARPDAPFILMGDGNAMAAAVYGPAPLPLLIAEGAIRAEGDVAAAQDFVDMFRLEAQPWPSRGTVALSARGA